MSGAFKPGTLFNAHAPTLRVKKTLTILLVLACGLSLDISQAQTSEEPLEEIVVTGEHAGPGMWQVTHLAPEARRRGMFRADSRVHRGTVKQTAGRHARPRMGHG
jgi:hypothetical protein